MSNCENSNTTMVSTPLYMYSGFRWFRPLVSRELQVICAYGRFAANTSNRQPSAETVNNEMKLSIPLICTVILSGFD